MSGKQIDIHVSQLDRTETESAQGEIMTNEELTNAINDSIYDFSDSLRGFLEEAARRMDEGRGNQALSTSSRFGARIIAFIENENSEGKR